VRANSKAFFQLIDSTEAEQSQAVDTPEAQQYDDDADNIEKDVTTASLPLPAPASALTTAAPSGVPTSAEVIRYACKACRAVLVTNDEVQKHLPPAGSARGEELCQQLFIKPSASWVKKHDKVFTLGHNDFEKLTSVVGWY
jgi:hypothetical protein